MILDYSYPTYLPTYPASILDQYAGGIGVPTDFGSEIEFLPETFLTLTLVPPIVPAFSDFTVAFEPETNLTVTFLTAVNLRPAFAPETFLTIVGLGRLPVIRTEDVDVIKPTSVFWYHEHRLYASIAGRTYCRDLTSGTSGGWTDCGYGYVNSRYIITRFAFPHTVFLAANMEPLAYGDRTDQVSLTHRNMTPEHLHTDVVPEKMVQFRPFGSREAKSLAERLRVWGSVRSRNGSQKIGTLTWRGKKGTSASATIYKGLQQRDLVLEQRFPYSFVMWLLECDLELDDDVVDAELREAMLELKPQDY